MCKHYGESIDNLLPHCEVATKVWDVFFQLFGVSWVMPRKVSDWHALRIWRLVPLCVMWCLWREWNARSFECNESGMIELRKLTLHTLFSWNRTWSNSH